MILGSGTGTEPELHHFSKIDDSSSHKRIVLYRNVTVPELELTHDYIVAMIPVPFPVKNGLITPLALRSLL